jgi:hypothetical protein
MNLYPRLSRGVYNSTLLGVFLKRRYQKAGAENLRGYSIFLLIVNIMEAGNDHRGIHRKCCPRILQVAVIVNDADDINSVSLSWRTWTDRSCGNEKREDYRYMDEIKPGGKWNR